MTIDYDGDERARFEAWADSNGFGPKYRESMFAAWQAALASNKAAAVAKVLPEDGELPFTPDEFINFGIDPPAPIASAEEVSPVQLDDFHALNCGVWGSNHSCTCHCAAPHNQIASVSETVPVAEIVLFGGDVKEVAWTQGKMPEVGTKLYTHPAAAQPSRAEVLEEAAMALDANAKDSFENWSPLKWDHRALTHAAHLVRALKDKP